MTYAHRAQKAFTVVELLIVIVVIAILAAITIVAYNGIQKRAEESAISSKETQAKKKLELYKIQNDDTYPHNQSSFDSLIQQSNSDKHYFSYSSSPPYTSYTLTLPAGSGSAPSILMMQNITNANCPAMRSVAVDARDNKTYWVQKLADGKCWMLTNLAYAGGGANTHSDIKVIVSGSGDTSATYTSAKYYIPSGANPTSAPTEPSTATNGTGQYGYLYNWCAAMGAQTDTSACMEATTPLPNPLTSICPNGWRLPTGGPDGEYESLNNAINNGLTNTDGGLRTTWLSQYAGALIGGSVNLTINSVSYYTTSTQRSATSVRTLYLRGNQAGPTSEYGKANGLSVRCLAN